MRLTEEDFENACKQVLGNDENWRAKSVALYLIVDKWIKEDRIVSVSIPSFGGGHYKNGGEKI